MSWIVLTRGIGDYEASLSSSSFRNSHVMSEKDAEWMYARWSRHPRYGSRDSLRKARVSELQKYGIGIGFARPRIQKHYYGITKKDVAVFVLGNSMVQFSAAIGREKQHRHSDSNDYRTARFVVLRTHTWPLTMLGDVKIPVKLVSTDFVPGLLKLRIDRPVQDVQIRRVLGELLKQLANSPDYGGESLRPYTPHAVIFVAIEGSKIVYPMTGFFF